MTTFGYWYDVVDAGAHRVRWGEVFINRLATDSADVLRGKDDLLIGFELRAVRSVSVWAVDCGSPHFF